MGPDDENDDDFGVGVSDDAIPMDDEGEDANVGSGRRRGWGGGGCVGHDERDDDRSPSSLLRVVALVAVDDDVSLSLLRRESGPGQAREWRSEMRRRHKRWRCRLMGGVGVTRGERRRDNQPDKRHESGRWRRKQQQLQLRNNQQKERGRRRACRHSGRWRRDGSLGGVGSAMMGMAAMTTMTRRRRRRQGMGWQAMMVRVLPTHQLHNNQSKR